MILVLAAAWAPGAGAQVAEPQVDLVLHETGREVASGERAAFAATVRNGGPLEGAVTIALRLPDGWQGRVWPQAVRLAAGASADLRVDVEAPAAEPGADAGALVLVATLRDAAGRVAEAEATASLARAVPPPVPPSPPPVAAYVAAGGIATAAVAAGAFAGWRRRRARLEAERAVLARETGILLGLVDGAHVVSRQREMSARVAVENASDRPRVAVLDVAEATPGWQVGVSLPRIPLSPGERVVATMTARAGPDVPPGAPARFVVRARPAEARERDVRVVVDATAPVGGLARGPEDVPIRRHP